MVLANMCSALDPSSASSATRRSLSKLILLPLVMATTHWPWSKHSAFFWYQRFTNKSCCMLLLEQDVHNLNRVHSKLLEIIKAMRPRLLKLRMTFHIFTMVEVLTLETQRGLYITACACSYDDND